VTDEMFEAVRGQLKKDYYNGFIKPEKQGRHLRLQILQNTFHSHLVRHGVVGTITKEQVRLSIISKHYLISQEIGNFRT
jgi:hypothetical protein